MKIAHISDLHLNTLFNDSNLQKIKKIIKYISSKDIDHLIISGDLADNADDSDLHLLKRILGKEGFSRSDNLTVIPGNHDIFGGPQKPDEIFTFPDRCREVDFEERVNTFNQIFKESFSNIVFDDKPDEYPFAKIIGDTLIIGINSIAQYSKFKNPFASNGEVSLTQFNRINEILEKFSDQVNYKVVAIHHHFNKIKNTKRSIAGLWQSVEKQTMKLRKKRRLLSLFNKYKVDLVLHGHIHFNESYEREGLIFLNGGASSSGYTGKSIRVNMIELGKDGITCELHKVSEEGKVKIEELFKKIRKVEGKLSPIYSSKI
ncbi:MAG: metallophosphoesterase [Ignavibacteriaceae bacterium]